MAGRSPKSATAMSTSPSYNNRRLSSSASTTRAQALKQAEESLAAMEQLQDENDEEAAAGAANSQSTNEAVGSKRRSVGRRVSFAAKAKVRFIDNGDGNKKTTGSSQDNDSSSNSRQSSSTSLLDLVSKESQDSLSSKNQDGSSSNEDEQVAEQKDSRTSTPTRKSQQSNANSLSPLSQVRQDELDDVFSVIPRSSPTSAATHNKNSSMIVADEDDTVVLSASIKSKSKAMDRSDSDMSMASNNDSIEVEVRDPASSFSSYADSESTTQSLQNMLADDPRPSNTAVGGNINSSRLSTASAHQPSTQSPLRSFRRASGIPHDMDMTLCVGGLIASANSEPVDMDDDEDDETLDLTGLISGEALRAGQAAAAALKERPLSTAALTNSPSSVDTMELTRCVGGILAGNAAALKSKDSQHVQSNSQDAVADIEMMDVDAVGDQDDMEMTAAVGQLVQPSTVAMDLDSEVCFIGDITAPETLAEADDVVRSGTVSPNLQAITTSSLNQNDSVSQPEMEAIAAASKSEQDATIGRASLADNDTVELFSKYINSSEKMQLSAKKPWTEIIEETIVDTQLQSQAAKNQESTPIKSSNLTSTATTMAEVEESPTVTMMIPRASLRVFLQDTGVRFLDQLSSTSRRETMGRPRESEIVSGSRQIYVSGSLHVECEHYEDGCEELSSAIVDLRDELAGTEQQFDHSPPMAFLEWHRQDQQRPVVASKMKSLKNAARLMSKQKWYSWRQTMHHQMNARLQENLQMAQQITMQMDLARNSASEMVQQIRPLASSAARQLAMVQLRHDRATSTDWALAEDMEVMCSEQNQRLKDVQAELESLKMQEQTLREQISQFERQRMESSTRLASQQAYVEQLTRNLASCSLDRLSELEGQFLLLQGVLGVRLQRLSLNSLAVLHISSGVAVTIAMDDQSSKSTSPADSESQKPCDMQEESVDLSKSNRLTVSLDAAQAKGSLAKLIERWDLCIPASFDLRDALIHTLLFLDRLVHLEQQLDGISVSCVVQVPIISAINEQEQSIPITLRFMQTIKEEEEECRRFDLILRLDHQLRVHLAKIVSLSNMSAQRVSSLSRSVFDLLQDQQQSAEFSSLSPNLLRDLVQLVSLDN